ncbi:hypothetical protein [Hymenobacter segetis]|uniref:Uncharacterized protein n=1 Tax=Hymenobacter segetis TaxID=2025509 RepID=A0ABU9LYZ3_9BACT
MPAYPFRFPLFVCVVLLFLSGLGTSCNTKHAGTHYIAGFSNLTVFIDSLVADQATIDNTLHLELMTARDTFLVKPVGQELRFPQLKDSLIQVNIWYQDWYCPIQGEMLREEYPAMYFPGRNATISITTDFAEHPVAKSGEKLQPERVFYRIKFEEEGRFFFAPLTHVNRSTK